MSASTLSQLNCPIENNVSLAPFTTFQLGGPAKAIIHCQSPDELEKTIHALNEDSLPFILLGGGSNLVISDQGVDCFVVRYVTETPLIKRNGSEIIVSASTNLDALALYCAQEGLEGLNCTTGIPGTVGGAVVGNAGAFGKQVGDVLKWAELISFEGKRRRAQNNELGFTYRHSDLKETKDIVLEVSFQLKDSDTSALLKEREEILSVRRSKHPDLSIEPCAGSFFRNIEPTSKAGKRQAAGWFLDQAGGRELVSGGAKIFEKHANIIVKGKNCTSEDVRALSLKMQALAKEKFDLDLVREVRFVGDFQDKPKGVTEIIW